MQQKKRRERRQVQPKTLCIGSFDHFHKGHKQFLDSATALPGTTLVIALEKAPPSANQSAETRTRKVAAYLSQRKAAFEIVVLDSNDSTSSVFLDPDIRYLAISPADRSLAESINRNRAAQKRAPAIIIEIPFILAADSQPLTSQRIREGLIDEEGRLPAPRQQQAIPKTGNRIRDNLVELFLTEQGPLYGYQINKKYFARFSSRLSLRLTYYHLSKGVSERLFRIVDKRKIPGGYSWGGFSERIYYELAQGLAGTAKAADK